MKQTITNVNFNEGKTMVTSEFVRTEDILEATHAKMLHENCTRPYKIDELYLEAGEPVNLLLEGHRYFFDRITKENTNGIKFEFYKELKVTVTAPNTVTIELDETTAHKLKCVVGEFSIGSGFNSLYDELDSINRAHNYVVFDQFDSRVNVLHLQDKD